MDTNEDTNIKPGLRDHLAEHKFLHLLTPDEAKALVSGESTTLHHHDSRYYTETEIDTNFASAGHNHDSRYYTETEVDSAISTHTSDSDAHHDRTPDRLIFTFAGTLFIETDVCPALFPYASVTITKIKAYLKTAPSGGVDIIQINKNGSSLQQVSISDGDNSGEETGLSYSLTASDILTLDIDTTNGNGRDLTVILYCE